VLEVLKPYKKTQNIVFETCGTYYWLSDGLHHAGYKNTTMAHALKLAHIIKAKVKTDRRDSLALAELLRNNYIPEGYIYPIELREARDLARRRMNIVKKRAGEFREFKMALTRHGFDGPNRNAIVSMKDEILEPYRGFDRHLDQILEDTLYFNQVYTESIKSIESSLEDILEGDEIIERLREIPGIGPWLSKYIQLEVESIERFKNIRAFSSWCRVIPGIAQSGDSEEDLDG
jgi:transposase